MWRRWAGSPCSRILRRRSSRSSRSSPLGLSIRDRFAGMDAISAIQRRRSVRHFRPDPVPRETIERLLDCAVRAPNHKLTQPWRFAVITRAARSRLAEIRARHRSKRYADPASAEAQAGAEKVRREALETPAFIVV